MKGRLTEYDLIASGIETIISTRRPKVDRYGGLNSRFLMPPVCLFNECFIEDQPGFWLDVTPDLLQEVNCAVLFPDNEGDTSSFYWLRTASLTQRRGAKRHAKHMVALSEATLCDGQWSQMSTATYSWLGGQWVNAIGSAFTFDGALMHGRGDNGNGRDFLIRILTSVAFNMRYFYSMVLGDDANCLSARIFAYPDTIRFLLKTRDLGNTSRRRALLHLVRRHMRRRRKVGPVRSHLRGEHRCRWAGLDVAVLPSQYDAEQAREGAAMNRLHEDGLLRWVAVPAPAS